MLEVIFHYSHISTIKYKYSNQQMRSSPSSHKSTLTKSKIIAKKCVTDLDWNRVKKTVSPPATVISFTPKISPHLLAPHDRQNLPQINFNFSRTASTTPELKKEFDNQQQCNPPQNLFPGSNDSCRWETSETSNFSSTNNNNNSQNDNNDWNSYFATSIDFNTNSEVFDHSKELLQPLKSTGYSQANTTVPADPILLSSKKWWTSAPLRKGTGAVFQRIEMHETHLDSVISRQMLNKFNASSMESSPVGAESTPTNFVNDHSQNFTASETTAAAEAFQESQQFNRTTQKRGEQLFQQRIELADRSPIYVLNDDMTQWCVAGDTCSFPVNLRRHLLHVFVSYCMKVFGGVPVAGECVTMKKKKKNNNKTTKGADDEQEVKEEAHKTPTSSVLILGPLKSGKTSLAKHVVAEDPERIEHAGSGIVIIAPSTSSFLNSDGNNSTTAGVDSSPLRVVTLPLSSNFSDGGILFSALNSHIWEEEGAKSKHVIDNLRRWADAELKKLPPSWRDQILSAESATFAPNTSFFSSSSSSTTSGGVASSSSNVIDFPLNAIVTLNWAADSLGAFEEDMLNLNKSSFSSQQSMISKQEEEENQKKLEEAKKLCREKVHPCYVRDMNETEIAEALAHSSCPPVLSRGIYYHEPRRLSDQLYEWGTLLSSEQNSSFKGATELNSAVRFDLARRHVKQVLESQL